MNCKVLRIGVFFDGTGNNLFNDLEKFRESNVAKLYRLYCSFYNHNVGDPERTAVLFGTKATECRIVTKAIYIEGLGTTKGKSDDWTGLGMGSGGAIRIQLAMDQLDQVRQKFPDHKCYIDVFGFSRGSALARDFINTMYETNIELDFSFKFVGLFDTVASFGRAGDDKDYKPVTEDGSEGWAYWYEVFGITPSLEKYIPYNFNLSPQSAERVVHLTALDEYRENFPLTDTNGVGETYELIGAHSDVGGGYEPKEDEQLFEYYRDMNSNTALQQVNQPENGIVIGENWKTDNVIYIDDSGDQDRSKFMVRCQAVRKVTNDLQDVGLILMYNLAVQAGVPLLPFRLNRQDAKLDDAEIRSLKLEIMYSKYQPATQTLHRHSHQLEKLLGKDSQWQQALKDYCIQAIENPTELASYLKQKTPTMSWADKENKNSDKKPAETPIRSEDHLRILAKYAHNSSATKSHDGFKKPPFGFKHRQVREFSENFSNPANYPNKDAYPARLVFQNNPNDAIIAQNPTQEEPA